MCGLHSENLCTWHRNEDNFCGFLFVFVHFDALLVLERPITVRNWVFTYLAHFLFAENASVYCYIYLRL